MTYLPCVTSGLIPGIFILHGGVYLTDRELFVWAAQDSTPEDDREGVRWPAVRIPQAVQARWAMRMLLMFYSVARLSDPRNIRADVGLTGHFRLSIVVRIDRGGGLVVDFTPNRDNQSTQKPPRTKRGARVGQRRVDRQTWVPVSEDGLVFDSGT